MTNRDGIITEDVRDALRLGQNVYDRESTKVGTVDAVERTTGWVMVGTNPLSDKELYIPVRLITSIDPRELYVAATKAELLSDYDRPPRRSTIVSGVGEAAVATTTEPSGYDGGPIVVKRTRIALVGRRIVAGDHVVTADGADLGAITRYDATTGRMLVEQGRLAKHELLVPIALVDHVVRELGEVRLVVSQADVRRLQHATSVDMVLAGCAHLDQLRAVAPGARGCEDCLASGATWSHLRLCMTCGHVGCSDDSPNRHAARHFHVTRHPISRSFEPGDSWGWCYVDHVLLDGADWRVARPSVE